MTQNDSQESELHHGSAARALRILESFSVLRPNLSFNEIEMKTCIPRSSVFRLLKTLTHLNYLRYHAESKKYSLGPRVLSLGFSVLQSMEIRELARPFMERLSREFNKSVNLLMLDRERMVFIERIRVPGRMDFNISVGSTVPAYSTASGKVVLSHLDDNHLAKIVREMEKDPQAAKYVGKNGKKLAQALKEVRQDGFAIYEEEVFRGFRAVAVPILTSEEIPYAMDIIVGVEEASVDKLKTLYAPKLIKAGKEISKVLGHVESDQIKANLSSTRYDPR
ncbi:MAG: IclR family transcriptional regulator [Desulfobacteraceae bacterium]|nr:MAG: IclR family transcriptional regulator [Desulfobacteraceae bacterium]